MKTQTFNGRALTLAVASILAVGLGTFSGASRAGTETANLAVSATISANCTIDTTALDFGGYDPIVTHKAAPLDGTGTVTTVCTNGSAVAITLGQGVNADTGSSDPAPLRRLTDGTNFLSYDLYSDSGRSVVWGNDATVDVERTGTGVADVLTVYGQIPQDQNVPAGTYTDTVVATVTF
ncbi:MAG: Csu type fimbrial protein [Gammaproteobacteria bacterium]